MTKQEKVERRMLRSWLKSVLKSLNCRELEEIKFGKVESPQFEEGNISRSGGDSS